MKRKRRSGAQIALALRQADGGTGDLPQAGVSGAAFCRRRKQFAGMGTAEARRLERLEEAASATVWNGAASQPMQASRRGRKTRKVSGQACMTPSTERSATMRAPSMFRGPLHEQGRPCRPSAARKPPRHPSMT